MKKIFALMLIGSGFMDVSVYAGGNPNPVINVYDNKQAEIDAKKAIEKIKNIIDNASDPEIVDADIEEDNSRIRIFRNPNRLLIQHYNPAGAPAIFPATVIGGAAAPISARGALMAGRGNDLKAELQKIDSKNLKIDVRSAGGNILLSDPDLIRFFIDNFEKLRKLSAQDITDIIAQRQIINAAPTDAVWANNLKALHDDGKVKHFFDMYQKALKEKETPEIERFIHICERFFVGGEDAILDLIDKYNKETNPVKKEELLKKAIKNTDTREMEILNEIFNAIDPTESFNKNVNAVIKADKPLEKQYTEESKPALFDETKDRDALKEEAKAGVAAAQARRAEKRLNDFAEKLDLLLEGDKTYKKYLPGKKAEEERKAVQEILMIVNNLKADDEEINRAIDDGKVSDTETANVLRESINSTWKEVSAKVNALDATFDKKEGKNGNVKYKKGWQGKLIGMLNQAIPMNIKESGTPTPSKENAMDETPIKELEKFLSGKKIEINKKNKLMDAMNKVADLLKNEKITFAHLEKIKDMGEKLEKVEFKGKKADDAKKEVMDLVKKNIEALKKALQGMEKKLNPEEQEKANKMYDKLMKPRD